MLCTGIAVIFLLFCSILCLSSTFIWCAKTYLSSWKGQWAESTRKCCFWLVQKYRLKKKITRMKLSTNVYTWSWWPPSAAIYRNGLLFCLSLQPKRLHDQKGFATNNLFVGNYWQLSLSQCAGQPKFGRGGNQFAKHYFHLHEQY